MLVNLRVLQYGYHDDNLTFKILLNGQGKATLDVFVCRTYFPGSDTYTSPPLQKPRPL